MCDSTSNLPKQCTLLTNGCALDCTLAGPALSFAVNELKCYYFCSESSPQLTYLLATHVCPRAFRVSWYGKEKVFLLCVFRVLLSYYFKATEPMALSYPARPVNCELHSRPSLT